MSAARRHGARSTGGRGRVRGALALRVRTASFRLPWRAALPAGLLLLGAASAQPGPSLTGSFEVRYTAAVGYSSLATGPAAGADRQPYAAMLLGAHADLDATWRPLHATLRLDPAMLTRPGTGLPSWEPGLTEAFVLLREGPVDASAGLERLPLETARLTVPFQVDTVAADGTRRGLWGARVSAYVGALRLRAAGFVLPAGSGRTGAARPTALATALSARLDLTSAQLEAHALYLEAPDFGVGASGTLGQTVVYGEAWLLASPWRGRGAVGASGYLGDALWTLEAAYAPPPGVPAGDAVPQLAGQLDVPLANGDNLHALADVALAEDPMATGSRRLQASASALWETGDAETTLRLGPGVVVAGSAVRLVLQAQLDAATGF